jgi:hypothetical protein
MADSPDSPYARYDEQLRGIPDLGERWVAYLELAKHLEDELELWRRRQRQEIALGLRDSGKTWKEIGAAMGGVSPQRAHQYSRAE